MSIFHHSFDASNNEISISEKIIYTGGFMVSMVISFIINQGIKQINSYSGQ